MKKDELIENVSKTSGLPNIVVTVVLEALKGEIIEIIENGDILNINNFCTLGTKTMKPREYIDVVTGEKKMTESKKVPYFNFSEKIKDIARQADFDL